MLRSSNEGHLNWSYGSRNTYTALSTGHNTQYMDSEGSVRSMRVNLTIHGEGW